jgi:nitroimidazol reductase NimA-like FMN-containing flavoprotein (pyridoxamine 5'-phosphate oxidase superfamily)
MIIRELDQAECTALIHTLRFGRLAVTDGGQPYVVPIHYAYRDGCIYAFTLPGRKLEAMRANPRAALLVEERGEGEEWRSVIAEGRFEELPDEIGHKRDRDFAWQILSANAQWWSPGALKPVNPPVAHHLAPVFFRIRIEKMSGREARDAG